MALECSSAACSSERSRASATKPITAPASSCTAFTVRKTGTCEPSRRLHSSSPAQGLPAATPASTEIASISSRGITSVSTARPNMSASGQPRSFVAASFQIITRPSRSVTTIMSGVIPAIPLITGPGAISATILLAASSPRSDGASPLRRLVTAWSSAPTRSKTRNISIFHATGARVALHRRYGVGSRSRPVRRSMRTG